MKNGYTILIVILVLTAVGVLIITTLSFLGIDQTRISLSQKNSSLNLYLSTACAEEALERIKNNPTYVTNLQRITIDSTRRYYCWFMVNNPNPPKFISAWAGNYKGRDPNFPRYLEIKVSQVKPNIIIDYWLER